MNYNTIGRKTDFKSKLKRNTFTLMHLNKLSSKINYYMHHEFITVHANEVNNK